MQRYFDSKKTLEKGATGTVEGGVLVAMVPVIMAVLGHFGIEVDGAVITGIVTGLASAYGLYVAVMNWRKHGHKPSVPRGNIPYGFLIVLGGLGLAMSATGCARTMADFDDAMTTTEFNLDGSVSSVTESKTAFRQANTVTWGSELEEGAGNMYYDWAADGSGNIAVGNVAKGAKAGELDLAAIGSMLMKPSAATGGTKPVWLELVDMLLFYSAQSKVIVGK